MRRPRTTQPGDSCLTLGWNDSINWRIVALRCKGQQQQQQQQLERVLRRRGFAPWLGKGLSGRRITPMTLQPACTGEPVPARREQALIYGDTA